jgi:GNAT superfamily N-acetyltransferase
MNAFHFIIRDGIASDIEECLNLDHTYETEYVWQMSLRQEPYGWQVAFRTERLPRAIESLYPANAERLYQAVQTNNFLVVIGKDEPILMGYLTLRFDPIYATAMIQDLVVNRHFRRRGIGKRLLNIARRRAVEHEAQRLLVELQTKNYLGIQFCQASGLTFCGFNDQYFPQHDIAVFFGQPLR